MNCNDTYKKYKNNCEVVYDDESHCYDSINNMNAEELINYLKHVKKLFKKSQKCYILREKYREECIPNEKLDTAHEYAIELAKKFSNSCLKKIKDIEIRFNKIEREHELKLKQEEREQREQEQRERQEQEQREQEEREQREREQQEREQEQREREEREQREREQREREQQEREQEQREREEREQQELKLKQEEQEEEQKREKQKQKKKQQKQRQKQRKKEEEVLISENAILEKDIDNNNKLFLKFKKSMIKLNILKQEDPDITFERIYKIAIFKNQNEENLFDDNKWLKGMIDEIVEEESLWVCNSGSNVIKLRLEINDFKIICLVDNENKENILKSIEKRIDLMIQKYTGSKFNIGNYTLKALYQDDNLIKLSLSGKNDKRFNDKKFNEIRTYVNNFMEHSASNMFDKLLNVFFEKEIISINLMKERVNMIIKNI